MVEKTIVEMRNIYKSFYGVTVFKDFSLDFRAGEIHCICGENGAGKSTLIKILSGAYQPDGGEIFFEGVKRQIQDPIDALKLGIQTVYQENTLFDKLSVCENLFAGREYTAGVKIDKKRMVKRTEELMKYLQADISPHDTVADLSSGEQKVVEIARGLVLNTKMVILDEPTSSFSRKEIAHLMNVVRKLRESGLAIIYISHHLEEVFELADRVTVIRDGQLINIYDIENLTYEKLIGDMVGRDVATFYKRDHVDTGDVLFEAKNLCGNGVVDISFQIRRGEILGFAGMVGAGKTEIAELVCGAKKLESGQLLIKGSGVSIQSPQKAIDNKICYITESRQYTGLFLDHTIVKNVVLPWYWKTKGIFAWPDKDAAAANKYVKKLNVITTSIHKKVKELSGGNQQKVVLAKWFLTDGDIYVFDEPTRGIDIGAREEIYKLMMSLIREGKCILLISSDMPEVIALSNRICVVRDGRIAAELQKDEITEHTILKHSIGGNF